MKHTGLTMKQARPARKVTGKHQVDWAYMLKRFPLHKEQIKAHKNNQEFLAKLKTKLEKGK